MRTLTKLKTMRDMEIQSWLRKVEQTSITALVYALLGADEEVKNCVLRNMSSRAASTLKINLMKYSKMNITTTTIQMNSTKLEKLL